MPVFLFILRVMNVGASFVWMFAAALVASLGGEISNVGKFEMSVGSTSHQERRKRVWYGNPVDGQEGYSGSL